MCPARRSPSPKSPRTSSTLPKTDSAGAYVFPNIVVGTYTLTVADPGFQTYSKIHNVLEVGSNIGIDAHLALGKEEQTVTVEAEGLALQTEDPKFKQTVDEKQIAELPLNSASRQVTGLIYLAGGARPCAGRRLHRLQVQLPDHLHLRRRRSGQHHHLASRWR